MWLDQVSLLLDISPKFFEQLTNSITLLLTLIWISLVIFLLLLSIKIYFDFVGLMQSPLCLAQISIFRKSEFILLTHALIPFKEPLQSQ